MATKPSLSHAHDCDNRKHSDRLASVSGDRQIIRLPSETRAWEDLCVRKPGISWFSTTLNDRMECESVMAGRGGLGELHEHIQRTHTPDCISLLVLRCESTSSSKSQFSEKFVFGRCVGSNVSFERRKRLRLSTPAIAKVYRIRHLIKDTDENLKGWTPQELAAAFSEVCDDQIKTISFGAGAVYRVERPEESAVWQGFTSQDEAKEFGRKYYEEILSAMTSSAPMSEFRKRTTEYVDPNARFVGNGYVRDGIESWERVCDEFAQRFRPTSASLREFEITSFSNLGFVATFQINFGFAVGSTTMTNEGTVSVVMSQHKKISHILEASAPDSLRSIRERLTVPAKDM